MKLRINLFAKPCWYNLKQNNTKYSFNEKQNSRTIPQLNSKELNELNINFPDTSNLVNQ